MILVFLMVFSSLPIKNYYITEFMYRCMVKDSDHLSKHFLSNILKIDLNPLKCPPSEFCSIQ